MQGTRVPGRTVNKVSMVPPGGMLLRLNPGGGPDACCCTVSPRTRRSEISQTLRGTPACFHPLEVPADVGATETGAQGRLYAPVEEERFTDATM